MNIHSLRKYTHMYVQWNKYEIILTWSVSNLVFIHFNVQLYFV